MKKYMTNYIKNIEDKLNSKITNKDLEEFKDKINFFSHERLIHLIVTMFFALFSLIFIFMSIELNNILLSCISFIMIIILLFYIVHYFYLENSVQYLYKLYDKMISKVK
jgi:uncharacterized membrane protein YoaK (UPF0700 family)